MYRTLDMLLPLPKKRSELVWGERQPSAEFADSRLLKAGAWDSRCKTACACVLAGTPRFHADSRARIAGIAQVDRRSGRQALELAYTDVARAFRHFLSRIDGRPFLLA